MTKSTAKSIAQKSSTAMVQQWASMVAQFSVKAHKALQTPMAEVCGECPFRNHNGCFGEECPVNAVRNAVRLAASRAAAAARDVTKARYL